MTEVLFYAAFFAIGLSVGAVTLRSKPSAARDSVALYLLAWACFWPGLLLHLAWIGIAKLLKAH